MKERLRILPAKSLSLFSLLLAYWPLYMLCCVHFLPEADRIVYWLPMLAWGLGMMGYLLPSRLRLPFFLFAGAGAAAAGIVIGLPFGATGLLPFGLIVVYLLFLPPALARPIYEEWALGYWFVGLIVHLAGQFIAGRMGEGMLISLFQGAFLIYVLLCLLMLNRHSLRESTHGAEKAPRNMRVRNCLLLLCLFIPAAIASCWGKLGEGLSWLFGKIGAFLGRIIAWIAQFLESDSMVFQENPGAAAQMDFGEAQAVIEKSLVSRILEIVLIVFAGLLSLGVFILICWLLGKQMKRLFCALIARLRRYAASAGEDYEDEAESTLDLDEKVQQIRSRMKNIFTRQRQTPWSELDGVARVRRLYQQYLQRRPEAKGMTAREAITTDDQMSENTAYEFASLYEKARYSPHPVSCEEADDMRKQLK